MLISGGAKVDDKLGVLQHLGGRADTVLIGGKMAEQVRVENPLDFPVELPTDVVGAAAFEEDAESGVYPFDGLPDGWLGLDIGPETREAFAATIAAARTIFWNGPMGVFEWERFAGGTKAVAEAVAANERRVLGRRRRRLGAGAERARSRRPHLVGLHRRRRQPRAARGQGAAGSGGDPVGRRVARMIVAGNWKMYAGPDPQALAKRLAGITGVDAIVCPPYTALAACVEAGLTTFAQNVHWEAEGAFTGEISAAMLTGLGVTGALVGHSERRQYFGETDEGVARRTQAALDAGLSVIACVGETQEERDAGETETVLRIQVGAIAPRAARTSGS